MAADQNQFMAPKATPGATDRELLPIGTDKTSEFHELHVCIAAFHRELLPVQQTGSYSRSYCQSDYTCTDIYDSHDCFATFQRDKSRCSGEHWGVYKVAASCSFARVPLNAWESKKSKAGEHLETGCSALWLNVRGLSDFRAGNTTANAPRYTKFQCNAQFVWSEKNNNGHASQRVCLKSAVSYLSHITAAGHCYKPGARTAAHRHLRRVGASRCPAATGGILGTTRRFSCRSAERT